MGTEPFSDHADRARRGQWQLEDLPWDEPIELGGANRREQTLSKLDLLDVCEALYHFQLGARIRMGDHMVRSWSHNEPLMECMEWHDIDEQRHVRGLRRLIAQLHRVGEPVQTSGSQVDPRRFWRVTYSSRERMDENRLLVNMLVDEAVSRTLYESIGKRSHVPLVRALYAACAEDEERHQDYLLTLNQAHLNHRNGLDVLLLQSWVLGHVAHVQSVLRPFLRAFAGVLQSSTEAVASDVFRSVSQALSELGPAWQQSLPMRLIHTADRSPWLLWLLR